MRYVNEWVALYVGARERAIYSQAVTNNNPEKSYTQTIK